MVLLRGLTSNPQIFVVIYGALLVTDKLADLISDDISVVGPGTWVLELSVYLAFASFAVRVALVGLIAERNVVLARNIRSAASTTHPQGGETGAVVAILGLAHLNGVKRLLEEGVQ